MGTRRLGRGHHSNQIYRDRKSTRLNSSHRCISYAVFCLKKKNGKRDAYAQPDKPQGANKDMRLGGLVYGVATNAADGSIWGSSVGFPGAIPRVVPVSNPS